MNSTAASALRVSRGSGSLQPSVAFFSKSLYIVVRDEVKSCQRLGFCTPSCRLQAGLRLEEPLRSRSSTWHSMARRLTPPDSDAWTLPGRAQRLHAAPSLKPKAKGLCEAPCGLRAALRGDALRSSLRPLSRSRRAKPWRTEPSKGFAPVPDRLRCSLRQALLVDCTEAQGERNRCKSLPGTELASHCASFRFERGQKPLPKSSSARIGLEARSLSKEGPHKVSAFAYG